MTYPYGPLPTDTFVAQLRVLLLSEHPPVDPARPANGLAVRHTRIAEALADRGAEVTYAHPDEEGGSDSGASGRDFTVHPVSSPAALALRIRRRRPDVTILGYWELAHWIPGGLDGPLVLDYIAPRMLERMFEDRSQLSDDARRLIALLSRCREVWIGNDRQADLMLPWLMLAGHDCRFRVPTRVVPIAGPVRPASETDRSSADDAPRTVFAGGHDWPWRVSARWLEPMTEPPPGWSLVEAGGADMTGFDAYLERLSHCDVLLELCDENTERRYSQSFRMSDALCLGVPVIANRFLPMASAIEAHGAGWLIDEPAELAPLLRRLADRPDELARAAVNARTLAGERLDAGFHYGALHEHLAGLAGAAPANRPQPLELAGPEATSAGWRRALRTYLGQWVHHRIRVPFHRWLRRRGADRPQPSEANGRTWIVTSRSDLFPTDHGAAVKIERTAWGLSFHVDRVVLLTDRRDRYWVYERGERTEHRFPAWPRLAGWPRPVNLLRLMGRGLPYSNAFLYLPLVDRGLHARLLWLLKRFPVETVQAEFPAYAHPAVWAGRLFGTRSLMVEHNVEFQRIADQVPELGARGARLLRRTEIDLANACDHVITVSDRDRDDLVAAGVREARVVTIPHGVDLQRFERAEPVDLRRAFDLPADNAVLVYHGIYSYPPNLEAVEELSSHLLPRLAERGLRASVIAFGPEPPAQGLPGVTFAGAVDDLAGHLMGADLAVIPLRAGGGTRMKILDDFAARVPVVTTSKGMEGLPVNDGEQLRVVDDPDAMADVVQDLLGDPDAREALAERAARWVSDLDWRAIAGRYVARVRAMD
ncbi:glycosyltransferase [Halomonas denitrificans]|nr:glycosyltransferase [Halomonas denitrificans]